MKYLEFFQNKPVYKYYASDILSWSDEQLETTHDFIQWVFPNFEKSKYNSNTPDLTLEEVEAIQNDKVASMIMIDMWVRMLEFYGFEIIPSTYQIKDNNLFMPHWISLGNHNFLRLTRILKAMKIFKFDDLAASLMGVLEKIHKTYPNQISAITFGFWKEAIK
jgi:hypothetical protein